MGIHPPDKGTTNMHTHRPAGMAITDLLDRFPSAIEGVHYLTVDDGWAYPVVRGGDGPDGDAGDRGDDAADGKGDDSGSSDGSDGSDGDKTTDKGDDKGNDKSGPAFPPNTPVAEMTPDQQAAYWRDKAQKHEKQSKANLAAAEKLRKANLTDTEKSLDEAKAAGRAEAQAEHAQALAGARLEAALTGIVDDPAEFVDDLNLAKFVKDGEVDTEAIAAVKAKYQKAAKATGPGSADGGARDRDDKPKRSSSIEGAVERKLSASA